MTVAGLGAAVGGPGSSPLPLLIACAALFLLTRARVAATPETRLLDLSLLALMAGIALQMVPLPGVVASALSPHARALQSMLHLDAIESSWPFSIDARLTRRALAVTAAPVLLFWAARETLAHGGIRAVSRTIAWAGLLLTMITVIQRATAPNLVLWQWMPDDPGTQPFGPFLNRNHYGTWLVMAGALTAGYIVAHRRTHRAAHSSLRLQIRDWLADGSGLILVGAVGAMALGLAASSSRAAIAGAAAAFVFALWIGRGRGVRNRGLQAGAALLAVALAAIVWANRQQIERKFEAETTVSRLEIWRDTAPLVRDFWLTGTGAGTYSPAMLRYQRTSPGTHFNQAHSEYVQLVAEGGLLLTLPVLVAFAAWLRLARREFRRERHEVIWIRIGAAAGLFGAAVQGIFETGWRVPANALLCALLAAIVVHEPRRPRE